MNSLRTNTRFIDSNITAVSSWNNLTALLKSLPELTKIKITILVTLTTALGYILAVQHITYEIIFPVTGIFLLACASSVLNHYQERETDTLMQRTCNRPLPSARVVPEYVLAFSILLLIAGTFIIVFKAGIASAAVGVFTFIWYNFVYTPLKKKTSFAIIPGSLVGALPPVAGWLAASGSFFDYKIWFVALYFFIWQIPHFWLLLMIYGDEYEKAGFPTLNSVFNSLQLKRITFGWIAAAVVTGSFVPLITGVNFSTTALLLWLSSVWMVYNSVMFLRSDAERKNVIRTFVMINFYTLIIISVLIVDRLL